MLILSQEQILRFTYGDSPHQSRASASWFLVHESCTKVHAQNPGPEEDSGIQRVEDKEDFPADDQFLT